MTFLELMSTGAWVLVVEEETSAVWALLVSEWRLREEGYKRKERESSDRGSPPNLFDLGTFQYCLCLPREK